MHSPDAKPHDDAGKNERSVTKKAQTSGRQAKSRDEDGNQSGNRSKPRIVGQKGRNPDRKHCDEMHGPDASADRYPAEHDAQDRFFALTGIDAGRK
jgi:hypothetical protein